jgi:LCP family protein required for cell wall assembly
MRGGPPPAGGTASRTRGGARRGRLRRPLTVALSGLLVLAGVAGWWLSAPFLRGIARSQPAQGGSPAPAVGIHKVKDAFWRPELGQPLFIAVLGSDVRSGPPGGGGGRCDAIHIVAINPQAKAGTILNFPRDSYVDIPGRGRDKINAACVPGPDLMVQTLKNLTDIPIQYYVMTEFSHFMKVMDELGGLDINVPHAMNDAASGARFAAGPQHLQGGDLLALSRNRKDAPGGDFGRTTNQAVIILAGLAKFRAETTADPHRMFDYLKAARRNTAISVPVTETIRLGLLAREIDPAAVKSMTIQGSIGSAGAASVVYLSPGDTYTRVRDDGIY